MSVGLYKYNGNIFDENAELILSENIASERIYKKYLEPSIEELNIHYFQDGAKIQKDNIVMLELELLIKWVKENVNEDNFEYLLSRLKYIKEVVFKSLKEDDDILYIF